MAKCPKCGASQYWSKLMRLNKAKVIICHICGSRLAMDSQRTTILIGGAIALVAVPDTGLLPFHTNPLWALLVFVVYMPFYFWYMKLNLVEDSDLKLTQKQEADFVIYARARKKHKSFGKTVLYTGLIIFFAGLPFIDSQLGGVLIPAGMTVTMTGFFIFSFTRCPFCRKITIYIPSRDACRCMNCHREIDVD